MNVQAKIIFVLLVILVAHATADRLSASFKGWCAMSGGDDACTTACRNDKFGNTGHCGGFLGAQCWCDT
uniref:Defensin n=1 Tax=Panagrolaimus sp. JU765 TaxID=591449 RepID=A0AC34QDH5_9BILA